MRKLCRPPGPLVREEEEEEEEWDKKELEEAAELGGSFLECKSYSIVGNLGRPHARRNPPCMHVLPWPCMRKLSRSPGLSPVLREEWSCGVEAEGAAVVEAERVESEWEFQSCCILECNRYSIVRMLLYFPDNQLCMQACPGRYIVPTQRASIQEAIMRLQAVERS